MILTQIPVPKCYMNITEEPSYYPSFKEDIAKLRSLAPEFDVWNDYQLLEYGNEHASEMKFLSSLQDSSMDIESMKDVAIAMVLSDAKSVSDIGRYSDEEDWHQEDGVRGLWNTLSRKE